MAVGIKLKPTTVTMEPFTIFGKKRTSLLKKGATRKEKIPATITLPKIAVIPNLLPMPIMGPTVTKETPMTTGNLIPIKFPIPKD
ncbi:hypothetical protein AZF37_00385 [endosymbiont 'TC1' of Trimyema compressum]|nr:hypothetical protein AZF37_00385 [endosymbiont 'TC1' of Trimyema compressum]